MWLTTEEFLKEWQCRFKHAPHGNWTLFASFRAGEFGRYCTTRFAARVPDIFEVHSIVGELLNTSGSVVECMLGIFSHPTASAFVTMRSECRQQDHASGISLLRLGDNNRILLGPDASLDR
jgi:hypothetical protein